MKLSITHLTQYDYEESVTDSVNEIRLTPSTNERQSCYHQSITVEPNAPLLSYEDFFGNRVHVFSVNRLHRRLSIRTSMTVVTTEAPAASEREQYAIRQLPEQEWQWLLSEDALNRFAEFLLETEYTAVTDEVKEFAHAIAEHAGGFASSIHIYDWLTSLCDRIRAQFTYVPGATTVNTTTTDLFAGKAGVCQDFAHLMIACARSAGIPARYVSGYHFVGDLQGGIADFVQASHAWVEAYVPMLGWRSFDPTNHDPVGERYIKLGHGRDYKDIVPVKGVYRGSGVQTLKVAVDVCQMEE